MFTIPRSCAALIAEPCPLKVKVKSQGQSSNGNVLCLLYNFKTFKDFFMKLYKYKASLENVQRKRNSNLSSSFEVIMPLCIFHIVISCSLQISPSQGLPLTFVRSYAKTKFTIFLPRSTETTHILPGFFCEHLLTSTKPS